jgi:hypothetical protein
MAKLVPTHAARIRDEVFNAISFSDSPGPGRVGARRTTLATFV